MLRGSKLDVEASHGLHEIPKRASSMTSNMYRGLKIPIGGDCQLFKMKKEVETFTRAISGDLWLPCVVSGGTLLRCGADLLLDEGCATPPEHFTFDYRPAEQGTGRLLRHQESKESGERL